jgi:hypothetical protein
VRARIRLRVVPNARKSEVVGLHGDTIKVKIAAPALDGQANEALIFWWQGSGSPGAM